MKKRPRKPIITAPPPRLEQPGVPEPPQNGLSWRPHLRRILAIWVLALAAYSSSFQSGLVLDNSVLIGQDPRIRALTSQNLHLILSDELWYKNSTTGLYRPLTTFSYLINYAILGNGPNPAGYHWINFFLHAANIALVYLLGLLVLEEVTLAWALAGIWGLHPLLTESVTNIVGRADLLAGFGVLAGLLCHVQANRSTGRRQLGWLVALAVVAVIGIFSKESAAVLPGIMLLYDLTWHRSPPWRSRWKNYAALVLPFAIFFKLRADLLAHEFVGFVPFLDNPLNGADFLTARLTAIKVIGKYLGLFLWPHHLSADYSFNAVPLFGWHLNQWEDLAAILALAGCVAAAVIAIRSYRSWKPLFFFILFFFVTLAPVANIFLLIGTIMAERFLYLPAVGLVGCLVVAGYAAARRLATARVAGVIAVLLCAACAARTFIRNFDWRDEHSLGTSSVAAAPRSFKAHTLLASALLDSNPPDLDGAAREVERMLAILDGLPNTELLGRPYELAGQIFRKKGDSLRPTGEGSGADAPSRIWYQKALIALLRGAQADQAENAEIRQVNLEYGKTAAPAGWPPLYLELGLVYRRLSDPQKALDALAYGQVLRPDDAFSEEMSQTRLSMGDRDAAAVALMQGLVLNPGSAKLPSELAALYRNTAPGSCALGASGNSIDLQCPVVHTHLCTASRNVAAAYAANGQRTKAAATARTAVQELGCPAQMFR